MAVVQQNGTSSGEHPVTHWELINAPDLGAIYRNGQLRLHARGEISDKAYGITFRRVGSIKFQIGAWFPDFSAPDPVIPFVRDQIFHIILPESVKFVYIEVANGTRVVPIDRFWGNEDEEKDPFQLSKLAQAIPASSLLAESADEKKTGGDIDEIRFQIAIVGQKFQIHSTTAGGNTIHFDETVVKLVTAGTHRNQIFWEFEALKISGTIITVWHTSEWGILTKVDTSVMIYGDGAPGPVIPPPNKAPEAAPVATASA